MCLLHACTYLAHHELEGVLIIAVIILLAGPAFQDSQS